MWFPSNDVELAGADLSPEWIEALSTRLFPKLLGADQYVVSGIAARCDWVVITDDFEPRVRLVKNRDPGEPRHIFLSLRSPFVAVRFFFEKILPGLSASAVLISGSEDVTIPNQTDVRWRRFDLEECEMIRRIADDERISHWFVENLDDASHQKMVPFPLGMLFAEGGSDHAVRVPKVPPLSSRPRQILCGHRIRTGAQWDLRKRVSEFCRSDLDHCCTVLDTEIPEAVFLRMVEQHAFVLCVEGGGLDPSPKAWQTILHGAIPVVRSGPLDAVYREWPVAFVAEWNPQALSPKAMQGWMDDLSPHYDIPELRNHVLKRLGIDFWWAKISSNARVDSIENGPHAGINTTAQPTHWRKMQQKCKKISLTKFNC